MPLPGDAAVPAADRRRGRQAAGEARIVAAASASGRTSGSMPGGRASSSMKLSVKKRCSCAPRRARCRSRCRYRPRHGRPRHGRDGVRRHRAPPRRRRPGGRSRAPRADPRARPRPPRRRRRDPRLPAEHPAAPAQPARVIRARAGGPEAVGVDLLEPRPGRAAPAGFSALRDDRRLLDRHRSRACGHSRRRQASDRS